MATDGVPETKLAREAQSRARRNVLTLAQVVFLVAALVFAGVSLRGKWPDVVRDVARISALDFGISLTALFVGLLAFGMMWVRVLAGFGYRIPIVKGLGIFYVGQLGRYIPGSIWSFGAQAALARGVKIPPRVTVVAGLVGLGFSLATAAIVGLIAVALRLLPLAVSPWLAVALSVLIAAVLFSPLINLVGTKVVGKSGVLCLRFLDTLVILALLAVTWVLDGVALMILSGGFGEGTASWTSRTAAMVGAYGLSYVVGVVVIFAPAGLGARETALTLLLTPALGLTAAAALAIVSRIPITITDFSLALVFGVLGRRGKSND